MLELEAPITAVTVYTDQALITRTGTIELEAGEHEIRINNLPPFVADSLRATGQGPRGTRILNVDTSTAFYSRPPEKELQALQDEIKQLRLQQSLLKARQDALRERRQWLHTLGEQSRDFAKGIAQGQLKAQDCAEFFQFMSDQSLQDAQAALDLDQQAQQLQLEIDTRQRELSAKQGTGKTDRKAATVTLSLETAGIVTVEIVYIVLNASWHPQYDVRVEMGDGDQNNQGTRGEVEITYFGMVKQSTGERWENVALSLSTARPSLATILPELKPWYINVFTPRPPLPPMAPQPFALPAPAAGPGDAPRMKRMSLASGVKEENDTMVWGSAAPEAEPVADFDIDTTKVEQTGTALVFRVGHNVDIPSDNTPHKTVIARDRVPCDFDYVSAPALEENAHLRGTVTNNTERVFLAGQASIFLHNEYVGTTKLDMTVPNEQFKLFLGIDDNIKVKRELIERQIEKGNLLQSDLRRSTYAYRITLHNYSHSVRKVVLQDHLPIPQHERIKVRITQLQPQPAERTKLDILTWEFMLPPDGKQKCEYRFVVEHPQGLTITGLPQKD